MTKESYQPLLEVRNLTTYFHTFEGMVHAVENVSFLLPKSMVLGIVGESGCGKSVTAQSILRLIPEPPGEIANGSIHFHGNDLLRLPRPQLRALRGSKISMIFQEPMTSLNPVYTVGDQIAEMFMLHKKYSRKKAWEHVVAVLKKVQIPSPEKRARDFPHHLSGGMRQRVMIAMALCCNPEILIADEPTTALDVTVQAQILDLMIQLKDEFQTAIILITHDLAVIAEIAKQVIVMYAGTIMEEATTAELFENPLHPYTKALLKAIPTLGDRSIKGRRRLEEVTGMVPNLIHPPKGCRFYSRCTHAMDVCNETPPPVFQENDNHRVFCWLYPEVDKGTDS